MTEKIGAQTIEAVTHSNNEGIGLTEKRWKNARLFAKNGAKNRKK